MTFSEPGKKKSGAFYAPKNSNHQFFIYSQFPRRVTGKLNKADNEIKV